MLLRLAYLGVANVFALLRLLPVSNEDKDAEILALRHQITVLERQLGRDRVRFAPSDRVFLAALLHRLPRGVLRRARLSDFFEAVTLSGARLYVFAVIGHAGRRIRVLGATAHPTASWVAQDARNLVMDLEDAGCRARFMIRDRDGKYPASRSSISACQVDT